MKVKFTRVSLLEKVLRTWDESIQEKVDEFTKASCKSVLDVHVTLLSTHTVLVTILYE